MTGGRTVDNKIIKSTEELLSMDDGDEGDEQLDHWYYKRSWVFVQPLPMALTGIQGITLDNTVFMMGKLLSSIYNIKLFPARNSVQEAGRSRWRRTS